MFRKENIGNKNLDFIQLVLITDFRESWGCSASVSCDLYLQSLRCHFGISSIKQIHILGITYMCNRHIIHTCVHEHSEYVLPFWKKIRLMLL